MPKKFLLIIFIFTLISLAHPASLVFAETPTIQKAIENVRDRLDDLVTAKDDNDPNELNLRIETFKKVITLSITEAKDLKVKLLSLDQSLDDAIKAWQKAVIENLDKAIEFYGKQDEFISDNEKTFDIAAIKSLALEFKNWRDKNYIENSEQARNFILIDQKVKAIQIAKKRYQKISADLEKMKSFLLKDADKLNKLLLRAKTNLEESENLNTEARNLFNNTFINRFRFELFASSSPTSTIPTSTETIVPTEPITGESTSTVTSTLPTSEPATSTATSTLETNTSSSPPILPNPSIKDLIKDSLIKIKDAYLVFIEMSNLVRGLLK
ncbi:MAG: hypothetical protein QMD50_02635 [Patescibacteria group bacterium]|nr:hypothetical protein [Patescibacteria group bacterium]